MIKDCVESMIGQVRSLNPDIVEETEPICCAAGDLCKHDGEAPARPKIEWLRQGHFSFTKGGAAWTAEKEHFDRAVASFSGMSDQELLDELGTRDMATMGTRDDHLRRLKGAARKDAEEARWAADAAARPTPPWFTCGECDPCIKRQFQNCTKLRYIPLKRWAATAPEPCEIRSEAAWEKAFPKCTACGKRAHKDCCNKDGQCARYPRCVEHKC